MEQVTQITNTAERLFKRYGIKSITMDEIARALGISKKTLYQHFEDKDAIVQAVCSRHIDTNSCLMDNIHTTSANALEECVHMSRHIRAELGTINPAMIYDLMKYHRKAWDAFQVHKDNHMCKTLVRTIERGQREGFFRPEVNASLLAIMRVDQVTQSFDPHVYDPQHYPFAEIQDQLLEHFIRGMLTQKGLDMWEEYRVRFANESPVAPTLS